MVARKGLLAPQNTFLDTIAARFDGTRKYNSQEIRLDPSTMLNNMKKGQKFQKGVYIMSYFNLRGSYCKRPYPPIL